MKNCIALIMCFMTLMGNSLFAQVVVEIEDCNTLRAELVDAKVWKFFKSEQLSYVLEKEIATDIWSEQQKRLGTKSMIVFRNVEEGNYRISYVSPDGFVPVEIKKVVGKPDVLSSNEVKVGACAPQNTSVRNNAQNPFARNETLHIYPNPAEDRLFLEIGIPITIGMVANIYDTRGALIKSVGIQSTNQSIALNNIPEGIYFLQLEDNKQIWSYDKLIVN